MERNLLAYLVARASPIVAHAHGATLEEVGRDARETIELSVEVYQEERSNLNGHEPTPGGDGAPSVVRAAM